MHGPEVRVNDGNEFALSQQLPALQEVRSCVATGSSFSVAAQVLLKCCVTCATRVDGNKLASGKAAPCPAQGSAMCGNGFASSMVLHALREWP